MILFFDKGDIVPAEILRVWRASCPTDEFDITFSANVMAVPHREHWHIHALGGDPEGKSIRIDHFEDHTTPFQVHLAGPVRFEKPYINRAQPDRRDRIARTVRRLVAAVRVFFA